MISRHSTWQHVLARLLFPKARHTESALRRAVAGKIILVTGASYGVGEASACRLAQAGATVLLTGRTREKLEQVAEAIHASGGEAFVYPADLADAEQVDELAKSLLRDHARIDVVISNAGKSIRRSMSLSYDRPQDFERTISVNYLGPVRLLLQLLPVMQQAGQGQVVNVSAVGVRLAPAPRWAAYHASKTAFDIWLRSAAPEIHRAGIVTTSIYLPLVRTRMSEATPFYSSVPAMSADDAGALVCQALITQPPRIAPWWLVLGEILSVVLWRPVAWGMRQIFGLTQDSPASVAACHKKDNEKH